MDDGVKGLIIDPVVSATKQANIHLLTQISEKKYQWSLLTVI